MFSASTGVSSYLLFGITMSELAVVVLLEAFFFKFAACFFFCSSISLIDAAIAALKSGSSSSSGGFAVFDGPSVIGDFRCACDCDWGTYPAPECPLTSSRLICSALFRSSSNPSSTRASRGCIGLRCLIMLAFPLASDLSGRGPLRDLSVNLA